MTERCIICGWTLAKDQANGCVPGDCCYRPDDPVEQQRLRERRERFKRAVRATCCDACDYPECGCTTSADIARRAIMVWEAAEVQSR